MDNNYSFDADNDKAQKNKAQTEKSILDYLNKHSQATQIELAQAIGKSRRTIQDTIALLKEKGLLDYEGARKNGRWIVNVG